MIEKGWNVLSYMIYIISVVDGEEKKTRAQGYFYNETVECGGAVGDSVMVELQEQTGCNGYIGISEIKAYSYSKFAVNQLKRK